MPEHLLSRVTSIDFFGSIGLTPVGFVLAAVAATVIAPTTILAVGGGLGAILWFVPLAWRRVPGRELTTRGKHTVSPATIGVRRFELRTSPTRTERATRLRHTPRRRQVSDVGEELQRRPPADVGALADQQVPAVRDHPQRRAQPARVLETVLERHLPVAGAPEDEHRAADAVEVAARVVCDERQPRTERVRVQQRPLQEAVDGPLGEQVGVRHLERPEDDPPQDGARRRSGERAGPAIRPGWIEPEKADRELRSARRAGDAGCSGEHEPPHEGRVPLGEPQRDDTAERVPEHVRRPVEQGRQGVGEAPEGRRGQRGRASVPGEVGDDQAPPLRGGAAAR